jgi:hypothetical protein
VENRIADKSKWSSDEMGNVAADRMASEDPTDWTLKRPNLVNTVTLDAEEVLFQLLPGDVWNIYKEGSTPIPWKCIEEKRCRREHMEYLKARTAASIAIGRYMDWCGCNMSLAAKIWRCQSLSRSTRARVVKILYDQYWHGGNRSKGVSVSEAVNLKKCDLCGEDDSQYRYANTPQWCSPDKSFRR